MENKQTAVEWLIDQLPTYGYNVVKVYPELFEQAKQMEEKQRKDEYLRGYVEGIDSGSSYHPD